MDVIYKMNYLYDLARGKFRTSMGFCPLCNSDAPEIDDCPICEDYRLIKNDQFPPPQSVINFWREEYKAVIRLQLKMRVMVLNARRSRLKKEQVG